MYFPKNSPTASQWLNLAGLATDLEWKANNQEHFAIELARAGNLKHKLR